MKSLVVRTVCACAALVSLPGVLQAQARTQPQELKPASCPAADSALGRSVPKPKQAILGLYLPQRGETLLMSADASVRNAEKPLRGVWVTAHFPGRDPVAELAFGFQIWLVDSTTRAGAGSDLRLQFDGEPMEMVGRMSVQPTGMGGKRAEQVLTIGLTAEESRRMAAADTVRGRIGSTEFVLSAKAHEAMRSVYVAGRCGVKLR